MAWQQLLIAAQLENQSSVKYISSLEATQSTLAWKPNLKLNCKGKDITNTSKPTWDIFNTSDEGWVDLDYQFFLTAIEIGRSHGNCFKSPLIYLSKLSCSCWHLYKLGVSLQNWGIKPWPPVTGFFREPSSPNEKLSIFFTKRISAFEKKSNWTKSEPSRIEWKLPQWLSEKNGELKKNGSEMKKMFKRRQVSEKGRTMFRSLGGRSSQVV